MDSTSRRAAIRKSTGRVAAKSSRENVGLSRRNGGRRYEVEKRDRTGWTGGRYEGKESKREGEREREREREREEKHRVQFPPRGFCAQCDA